MATKDYASTLWKQLNAGLDSLYEKYASLKKESLGAYQAKVEALAPKYNALRNSASVQSHISRLNTDRRMAEKGLGASGEAVRRELLENAALQQNLTDIDLKESDEKATVMREGDENMAELAARENEEVSKYVYQMNEAYYKQLNSDREQALAEEKLLAEKKQQEFENRLKEEELALKKEQQEFEQKIERELANAKTSAAKNSGTSTQTKKDETSANRLVPGPLGVGSAQLFSSYGEAGFSPESVNPKALVKDLVEKHTVTDYRGVKVEDIKQISAGLRKIISNYSLSKDYRYEVYLYARALGYL